MRRLIVIALSVPGFALLGFGLSTGVAGAAEPVVHNCVGTTLSGGARNFPPSTLGHFVAGTAQAPAPGANFGQDIQALQAGLVTFLPNTCVSG
jgi:hypothetical protein